MPHVRRVIYHADAFSLYQRPTVEVELAKVTIAGSLAHEPADAGHPVGTSKVSRVEQNAAVLHLLDRLGSSETGFCSLTVNPGCFMRLADLLKHHNTADDQALLPLWCEDGEAIVEVHAPGSNDRVISNLSAKAKELLFFKIMDTNVAKYQRVHVERESQFHRHDCAVAVHRLLKVDAENHRTYVAMEALGLADTGHALSQQPLIFSTQALSMEDMLGARLWESTGEVRPVYCGSQESLISLPPEKKTLMLQVVQDILNSGPHLKLCDPAAISRHAIRNPAILLLSVGVPECDMCFV